MLHGPPTSLGRQLRSVLAGLSTELPVPQIRPLSWLKQSSILRINSGRDAVRNLHQCTTLSIAANSVALLLDAEDERNEDSIAQSTLASRRFRSHGWRRLKRRARVDYVLEALKDVGKGDLFSLDKSHGKPDLTYVNIKSPDALADFERRKGRHALDVGYSPADSCDFSLQRIMGSYIRYQAAVAGSEGTDESPKTGLSPSDTEFLHIKGFTPADVREWAEIVSQKDSLAAAQILARRTEMLGSESVPMFVYLHLLRRRYISARALRIFVRCTILLFRERLQRLNTPGIDNQPIFIAVVRLLRHAREVWPQSMVSIVEFLLHHIEYQETRVRAFDSRKVTSISYLLNKLMSLVSLSTAVHPFKDNQHQEAAIVPILRYMAEHHPPLQINRQGYRAVVRIQLVQRKTDHERDWAELKALSWPPWKVDRTAMDGSIEASTHGISKAGATLIRMEDAGYAPLAWEKIAKLYTGWDIDRTPTIQLRALLGRPQKSHAASLCPDKHLWSARINCTRTVQEAWACYLAWEGEKLSDDQDVYLAIFQKLYKGLRSQRADHLSRSQDGIRELWALQPGDTRDVLPLPSSTHLHTYTATRPPHPNDLYLSLRAKGVVFKGHCLKHLVQHAPTLESGLKRLWNSRAAYPNIRSLFTPTSSDDMSAIPTAVLIATIELYARFPNVPFSKTVRKFLPETLELESEQAFIPHYQLSSRNSLSLAIELLRSHPIAYAPAWNSVLQGLTRVRNFDGLRDALVAQDAPEITREYDLLNPELQAASGAITAYRIIRQLLLLMREHSIDLDAIGFHNVCWSIEHVAVSCWKVLQVEQFSDSHELAQVRAFQHLRHDVKSNILRNRSARGFLKDEFRILVGDANLETQTHSDPHRALSPDLPSLLTVPSPAILHAYIRALGWLADYNGLSRTVQWMHQHRLELARRQSQDRRGSEMMRKAIVALRVFLERSWLSDLSHVLSIRSDPQGIKTQPTDSSRASGERGREMLAQLRTPAESQLVRSVKELIEDVEDWEGWPSDDEVQDYVAHPRFDSVK